MTEVSGSLKTQFQLLEDQRMKKLQRRKQLQDEKGIGDRKNAPHSANSNIASTAFGVDDDLDLKLADPPPSGSMYSEELIQHLNDQIREMKDETGRLYKLLSERDLEVRQLRKKQQDRNVADINTGGLTNDTAATKIVELSKKVREMTSELESERTKTKQMTKKCLNLENELQKQLSNHDLRNSSSGPKSHVLENIENKLTIENNLKSCQEKLKQTELKSAEYRNQCQALRQELKVAHKVIQQEVGEGVAIQSLLGGASSWRGRAEQIITLQKKVNELRSQIDYYGNRNDKTSRAPENDDDFLSSATSRSSKVVEDRHRDQLRRMEKEKKEAQEKMAAELKTLQQDHETIKSKFEASKARNKILSTELKTVKQQMLQLLEKGKHDDELIEALLKQQGQLKVALDESLQTKTHTDRQTDAAVKHLEMRAQQENNLIDQLRAIVADKERHIKQLEEELQLSIQRAQLNSARALFNQDHLTSLTNGDPGHSGLDQASPLNSTTDNRPPTSDNRPPTVICEVIENGIQTPLSSSRAGSRLSTRESPRKNSAHVNRPISASYRPNSRTKRPSSANQRPSSVNHRTTSVNLSDGLPELELQLQEYKSLHQATAVERDRLSEFVKVLQQRISEGTQKMADSQTELAAQKRRMAALEKQVGKAKIEQGLSAKRTRGLGASATSVRDSMVEEEGDNLGELQISLEIKEDEIEALKVALQSTLQSKEEDLHLYSQMIEETKKVFLQGLRQYRGQPATS